MRREIPRWAHRDPAVTSLVDALSTARSWAVLLPLARHLWDWPPRSPERELLCNVLVARTAALSAAARSPPAVLSPRHEPQGPPPRRPRCPRRRLPPPPPANVPPAP